MHGDDLRTGCVLSQSQAPANTVTIVDGIDWIKVGFQRHHRATQVVGFHLMKGKPNGIQTRAWIDTGLNKAFKVEGIGMDSGFFFVNGVHEQGLEK
ncbi:hypothetical protein D3C76_1622130 [compost metagenome]